MIIVNLIYSYLISIVLLVITYVYLAEGKSTINQDTRTVCGPDRTHLLYTTGTCFKYFDLNSNYQINRESLRKVINLTDCESSTEHQLFTSFDYYFDENLKLNLVVYEKREGRLFGGELNLNSSAFESDKLYGVYNNITFTLDRTNKFAYLSNKEANRIERVNLANGLTEILNVNCRAPDYIQLSEKKLVWIEHRDVPENDLDYRTCFFEWSIKDEKQRQLGCVKERVQSFELSLASSSIYYVTKHGALYVINMNSTNESTLGSTLVYKPTRIKRRYQIQIFRFKLMFKGSSIDLYLSDLVHQGLLHANLDKFDASSRTPNVLFTDQPSLFDFKFINLVDCNAQVSSDKPNLSREIELNKSNRSAQQVTSLTDMPNSSDNDESIEEALKEKLADENFSVEFVGVDDLLKISVNERKAQLHSNVTQPADIESECILCNTTLFYSIVFLLLAFIMILSALLGFLSKKRFNTLIENEDDSATLCKKLNNIQFNIKKTIQTM